MALIPEVTVEQENEVIETLANFPGIDRNKAGEILRLIGFSLSPAFALDAPQSVVAATMQDDVRLAVENATGQSFEKVMMMPLVEVPSWRFNHMHIYLNEPPINGDLISAYRKCAQITQSKMWFDARLTPPKEWERSDRQNGGSNLKNLWKSMTITLDRLIEWAVYCFQATEKTEHDVRPLLELYRVGIFPFGVGATITEERGVNSRLLTLVKAE